MEDASEEEIVVVTIEGVRMTTYSLARIGVRRAEHAENVVAFSARRIRTSGGRKAER